MIALIGAFLVILIGMAKGSDWTSKLLNMSWENVLVILGAIATMLMQIIPLLPNIPAWVPVVLAMVIKAIKDMQVTTASPAFKNK